MNEFLAQYGIEIEVEKVLAPLFYAFIAVVVHFLLKQIVLKWINTNNMDEARASKVRAIQNMIISLSSYILCGAVILATMARFGVDISSLLAGLGISAAVLALALQNVAKDVIAGLAILTEGKYGVGDMIEYDGFRGRVIALSLKTTKIKNYRGKVRIIANRNIDDVVNFSQEETKAEVKVGVAYDSDQEKVMAALERVKKKLDGTMEEMADEIKIYGITSIEDSYLEYTLRCDCKPYKHFAVQRALRNEIIKEFNKSHIKIPFQQVEIHKESSK